MSDLTIRSFSSAQHYNFYEIDKDTTFNHLKTLAINSFSNLLVLEPTKSAWYLQCASNGYGGYGIFEMHVCVKESIWGKGDHRYEKANLMVFGPDTVTIEQRAMDWFEANQDKYNAPYVHRYGREMYCVLAPIRNYEPYVPRIK